jgi:DNA-directed RNA polymerase subunit F
LIETNLRKANLSGCSIYGISAWGVQLEGACQTNLVIAASSDEPAITVDNVEVAQFIYLLLHNEKIREVIATITSKAVLILGRFNPPERKAVLNAIREEIRRQHLLPILFDFKPSARQTTLETVSTLAHIARFVIADLTDAKSVLQELQAIVPNNPSVPVQLILLASQEEPGMLDFIHAFRSVLETYRYHSPDEVLASLGQIITRADKARERLGLTGR